MQRVAEIQARSDDVFLVERNKHATYEYSRFVAPLGRQSVLGACDEVRRQRFISQIGHRTWLENYVVTLEGLFDDLAQYRSTMSNVGTAMCFSASDVRWGNPRYSSGDTSSPALLRLR
jgi:hypothetical protein